MTDARKKLDVLVLNTGRVYLDIIFGNVEKHPGPGEEIHYEDFSIQAGGAFNTAAGLAKLELSTAIVADLGTDPFSDFLMEEIKKTNIHEDFIGRTEGSVAALSVSLSGNGDRRFYSHVRPMKDTHLSPDTFKDYSIRHIHMPGYRHNADYMDVLEEAKRHGTTLSLDSQADAGTLRDGALSQMLPLLDYLFCNNVEALALTGESTEEEAIRVLAKHCRCPVVKLGAGGAMSFVDGNLITVPTQKVKAVDTTGAGDGFAAGFLFGVLQGKSVEESLGIGNLCGTYTTTMLGATAAFPDKKKLLGLMDGTQSLVNHT